MAIDCGAPGVGCMSVCLVVCTWHRVPSAGLNLGSHEGVAMIADD